MKERNKQGTTILLVTHNILEAEQVVDRVAVINHGKLLAVDTVSKLKERVDQRLKLELTIKNSHSLNVMNQLSALGIVKENTGRKIQVLIDKEKLSQLFQFLESGQNEVEEFSLIPPSLEDVYFHIDIDKKEKVV